VFSVVLPFVGEFRISAGQLVGAATIMVLTAANCLGVRAGTWIQNIFTVAKTLALALLIVVGLFIASDAAIIKSNFHDLWSGSQKPGVFQQVPRLFPLGRLLPALMVAGGGLVGAFFPADAWNNVTFTAGETKNPQRILPLSMTMGTGLVIALYLLANVAYLC